MIIMRLACSAITAVLACGVAHADIPQPKPSVPKEDRRPESVDRDAVARLPADTDPMGLARHVDRAGDEAVLALLSPEGSAAEHYFGALAARWLRAPERALPSLVTLMGGTDPDVAPVAARAVRAIAERLSGDALRERGADIEALRLVLEDLKRLSDQKRLRADVQLAAGVAAAAFAVWLPASG